VQRIRGLANTARTKSNRILQQTQMSRIPVDTKQGTIGSHAAYVYTLVPRNSGRNFTLCAKNLGWSLVHAPSYNKSLWTHARKIE
jgi:hypothetical protein